MKIIATIGPKTIDKWIIKELIENGVDILRLNCAHFNKEEFEFIIKSAKNIKKDIHILVDLPGKKVRVSKELKYIYKIYNNQEVLFCGEDYYKNLDTKRISKNKYIPLNLEEEKIKKSKIKTISIKDNSMNFEVLEMIDGIVKARVLVGGIIRSGKGCNISDIYDDGDNLSINDEEHINWAIDNKLNSISQSFVESEKDISKIREVINERDKDKTYNIYGKVETPIGIKNINDILNVVDTIIIGRGDLVAEAGILDSVILQDKAINAVKKRNKQIIIGTHLLNNMKNGRQATLPEVESIYRFIKQGVDGFLLAGETSIGKAPIQTVKFLNSIIKYYENIING